MLNLHLLPSLSAPQELMMAKVYKLNVKVIVAVNNRLQLVEQVGSLR
jgi:thiamine pyrophosphate-dependent acetolactate synthase large subunit-like protein